MKTLLCVTCGKRYTIEDQYNIATCNVCLGDEVFDVLKRGDRVEVSEDCGNTWKNIRIRKSTGRLPILVGGPNQQFRVS